MDGKSAVSLYSTLLFKERKRGHLIGDSVTNCICMFKRIYLFRYLHHSWLRPFHQVSYELCPPVTKLQYPMNHRRNTPAALKAFIQSVNFSSRSKESTLGYKNNLFQWNCHSKQIFSQDWSYSTEVFCVEFNIDDLHICAVEQWRTVLTVLTFKGTDSDSANSQIIVNKRYAGCYECESMRRWFLFVCMLLNQWCFTMWQQCS